MPQLKATAGSIADAWYGQPSRTLEVVAVTGTNGKTSVAWWTAQALSALGQRCGVVGTLGVGEPPKAGDPAPTLQTTGLTTPDAVLLQATLAAFVRQGFAACTMEASSIGIVDHRLAGTRIAVAQFTNFTRDHLDYHGDMAAYWTAKRLLFGWPGLRAAVVNIDDEQGATLADELEAAFAQRGGPAVWTYSTRAPARLQAQNLRHLADGMAFDLVERDTTVPVRCALVGAYNVSNLLAVVGALRALGVCAGRCGARAAAAVAGARPHAARRRSRRRLAGGGGRLCAHPRRAGAGAAGAQAAGACARRQAVVPVRLRRQPRRHQAPADGRDRAPTGRSRGAHQRQPARREPGLILSQILAGIQGDDSVDVIEDRRVAIHDALARAEVDDVVLLAGKGHEETQEVAGVKRPFSDVAVAAQALALRGQGRGAVA